MCCVFKFEGDRMSIDNLTKDIKQWGSDRMITKNGKPMSQAIKSLEEVTEMIEAINNDNSPMVADGIGDVFVTLVMVAETSGLDMESCIRLAYEEIKDRKGYLRSDGTFMKV